jgi:RNA polymerase sigma-70 factor, ECF subfamily
VSSSETEWLDRAQHADEEAFTHLVETYQTQVYNLCYRMLGDPAEAEDAAQESFWRAYQAIQKYDQTRSFITWLLSIAAHFCIDQIRKRRMMVLPMDILPEEEAPDPMPGPESHYNRREEQVQVHQLLDYLSAQDRAAIIMRYWYDLSDEEIAKALSLTVSAVKSRLHRARKELAIHWKTHQAKSARSERSYHEIPVF